MKWTGIGRWLANGWLMLGLGLALFLLVEGALTLLFHARDRSRSAAAPHQSRAPDADAYPDSGWVSAYYEEMDRSSELEWRPYVYWRRRPFQGAYINVDRNGIRATTSQADRPPQGAVKIFVFGGSTLWGTGARDAFTIPSFLARALHRRGIPCHVVNFGESGYVATQEVIALLLELQGGRVPDLVVFFDGVNDTYSAWQQHKAGIPQNEFNRVREFNTGPARVLREAAARLATTRVAEAVLRRFGAGNELDAGSDASPASSDSLARDVVATYAANVELVRILGEAYGFECLFYWQPALIEKKHPTAYERLHLAWSRPLEPFFRETHEVLLDSSLIHRRGFRDLSTLFSDVREPVYIDWCHVSERGNGMIAERIAADVVQVVSAGR